MDKNLVDLNDLVVDNQLLTHFGATDQLPNETACGMAQTVYGERALCEATLTVLGPAWGAAAGPSSGGHGISLDGLRPDRLGPEIDATSSCEALGTEPTSLEEIHEELRMLIDFAGEAKGPRARIGRDWLGGEVQQRIDRSIADVVTLAATRPQEVPDVVRRLVAQSADFKAMPFDADGVKRLKAQVAAGRDLEAHRRDLPPAAFTAAERRVAAAAREQFKAVRAGIVTALATRLIVQRLPGAVDRLNSIADRGEAAVAHLVAVRVHLEALDQEHQQQVRVRSSGPTVALPEPDGNQMIRSILRQRGWMQGELVDHARERFLQRTIGHISEHRADLVRDADEAKRRLYELLPKVVVPTLAQLAIEAIRELQNEAGGMRFWDAVEAYGVEHLADELFHKAAPTLAAAGRDVPDFGLASRQFLLVHLPRAATGKEEQVRQRLWEDLAQRVAFCQPTDGFGRQDIVVVRLLVGIPGACWSDNRTLLRAYGLAYGNQHPPHLVGLLPDTPDGEASPAHLVLAGVLDLDGLARMASNQHGHDATSDVNHEVAAPTLDPIPGMTHEETDDVESAPQDQ